MELHRRTNGSGLLLGNSAEGVRHSARRYASTHPPLCASTRSPLVSRELVPGNLGAGEVAPRFQKRSASRRARPYPRTPPPCTRLGNTHAPACRERNCVREAKTLRRALMGCMISRNARCSAFCRTLQKTPAPAIHGARTGPSRNKAIRLLEHGADSLGPGAGLLTTTKAVLLARARQVRIKAIVLVQCRRSSILSCYSTRSADERTRTVAAWTYVLTGT